MAQAVGIVGPPPKWKKKEYRADLDGQAERKRNARAEQKKIKTQKARTRLCKRIEEKCAALARRMAAADVAHWRRAYHAQLRISKDAREQEAPKPKPSHPRRPHLTSRAALEDLARRLAEANSYQKQPRQLLRRRRGQSGPSSKQPAPSPSPLTARLREARRSSAAGRSPI